MSSSSVYRMIRNLDERAEQHPWVSLGIAICTVAVAFLIGILIGR